MCLGCYEESNIKIFIPVNYTFSISSDSMLYKNTHWFLIVADIKDKKFIFIDSLRGVTFTKRNEIIKYMKKFFEIKEQKGDLYKSRKRHSFSSQNWEIIYRTCTQQPNTFDCGVYLCLNLMVLSFSKLILFQIDRSFIKV